MPPTRMAQDCSKKAQVKVSGLPQDGAPGWAQDGLGCLGFRLESPMIAIGWFGDCFENGLGMFWKCVLGGAILIGGMTRQASIKGGQARI